MQKVFRVENEFALLSGEQVLWSGQPRQGIYLVKEDAFQIPFFTMWAGFAFFWEFQAATNFQSAQHGGVFFVIWGIPFCVMGAYLLVGRFFYESYERRHTGYAVTNKRVLIGKKAFGPSKLIAIERSNLPPLNVSTTSDGFTTIEFGERIRRGRSVIKPPTFEQIKDGPSVLTILQNS